MFQRGEPVEVIKGDHKGRAFFVKDLLVINQVLTYLDYDKPNGVMSFTQDMLKRADSD